MKHIKARYPWTVTSIRWEHFKHGGNWFTGIPLEMQLPEPDHKTESKGLRRWRHLPSLEPVWCLLVSKTNEEWEFKVRRVVGSQQQALAYDLDETRIRQLLSNIVRRFLADAPLGREMEWLLKQVQQEGLQGNE